MIKYFNRDGKHNWVDNKNVLVGFDDQQQCCENFNYLFSLDENFENKENIVFDSNLPKDSFYETLEKYIFDRDFIHMDNCSVEDGAFITFRLKAEKWNKDVPILYLTLVNHHNGYYSHGFEMKIYDNIVHTGSI